MSFAHYKINCYCRSMLPKIRLICLRLELHKVSELNIKVLKLFLPCTYEEDGEQKKPKIIQQIKFLCLNNLKTKVKLI